MKEILGKPMIGHVYERVSRAKILDSVVVATCDREIFDYIQSTGGQVVMTSDKHERASDRCAEAMLTLEKEKNCKYDIMVMVQGDEPMTHPEMIEEAIKPLLEESDVQISNLLGKIQNKEEFEDRNCIKVVCDNFGNALYFSREPIPTRLKTEEIPMGKQVCIIPFRRDFLIEYTNMPSTPLEIVESIDMLRILENGYKVRMTPTKFETFAVDTLEDLVKVESMMKNLND
ncbi:3-deoxy-manno-octulosonate cytidylyltransferase [Leptospira levettii]|nr:3-deoxy-manno-octulosonate cytidylyltransferase [Leptospira levettii]